MFSYTEVRTVLCSPSVFVLCSPPAWHQSPPCPTHPLLLLYAHRPRSTKSTESTQSTSNPCLSIMRSIIAPRFASCVTLSLVLEIFNNTRFTSHAVFLRLVLIHVLTWASPS